MCSPFHFYILAYRASDAIRPLLKQLLVVQAEMPEDMLLAGMR
jgi:hypothetical protein